MKEFNADVEYNSNGKITSIQPNKDGDMVVRVYTQAEIDREYAECMQEGVHTYHRVKNRIRQDR